MLRTALGLVARFRALLSELMKFGLVGVAAVTLDLVVFNLALTVSPDRPLTAKSLGTLVSATFAFALNRHWSFRHRERKDVRREYVLYVVLNALGLGIALLCLGLSHYVLGFRSRLADNIAANVVGLALATTFRFWSYRRFVWRSPQTLGPAAAVELAGGPAAQGQPVRPGSRLS